MEHNIRNCIFISLLQKQYDSSFNVIKMDEHEQNSSRVLFAYLNPRPWLPLWTPCETEKVFPTAWNIQTNTNGPKLTPLQPNNLKFQWNLATVFKANKSKMARKGTTNQRVQNLRTHSYNPLCFFSALPCSYQRKDVYYVPRKDQI